MFIFHYIPLFAGQHKPRQVAALGIRTAANACLASLPIVLWLTVWMSSFM